MSLDADETLSQRELRNESGRVLRAVAAGQSFLVTNAGEPVGRLVPVDAPSRPTLPMRPAVRSGAWSELAARRHRSGQPVTRILDELREDRL
ncbi:type II toxin-antitoxin system prevent-host-death family antitoxin [Micrococcus sp.]|uniref:type II toxin-antitoxin system Phd/YefM family antitoxin n=1 Tax=Micrococcus sp. TaxID=1271 RepID=UPI002A912BF4|nr:type II toxin-antitoxin system prevent-host-death family antitoxin [Micrococcus sp.]MDY6054271.1 type II toxin-antitoxin system prevent-host-death family antitoxin [Micrococcus sp.]